MNAITEAIARLLRGRRASRLLASMGIDAKRYWLLMDLFDALSERGEMLDQLGRNGVALKVAAWLYFALSGLISLVSVATGANLATHFATSLVFTGFILLSILLPETSNSLVNPVEGLVLAHQPINGATYTAAKLTHLARIVLYLVLGLNVVPALAGLLLNGSSWSYPFVHLLAAITLGSVEALLCCALFGWLIRFVPVSRLKAAGQLAAVLPFIGMTWMSSLQRLFAHAQLRRWLGAQAMAGWALEGAIGVMAAAIVVLGIRSLSGDYLIRVSGMVRGGSAAGARIRRSRMGGVAARFFGGQSSRAGFAFVSRMMLRDWQFRRQMLPLTMLPLLGLASMYASGLRIDPFSGRFTPVHVLPHIFGAVLFFVCIFLPYGSDYKGAWIFLLAPSRGAVLMPMMFGGGIVMAIAVGVQYQLVFRSPAIVMPTTAALGVAAWFITRSSLGAFEVSIRYHLGLLSEESKSLYQEVAV